MEQHPESLKCDHGLTPAIYTSTKSRPGHQFYRCPKPIGSQDRCKFFKWADDDSASQGGNLPQSSLQAPASASQSTLREPPMTPTPVMRKRGFSDDNTTPLLEKRVKIEHSGTLPNVEEGSQNSGKGIHIPQEGQRQLAFTTPSRGEISSHPPDAGSQETLAVEETKELSANIIEEMLRSLGDLPAYVRKLERRKIAAEKSRDAKASKIQSLEAEVERLKKREKELENLVATLESAS